MKKLWSILLWAVCGFYAYGTCMAELDYENKYEFAILHYTSRDNVGLCVFEGIIGPVGAVIEAFSTNFNQHGWELWEKEAGRE